MSTRIRLIVVGAALAALSLFGVGSALAGDGSSSGEGGQDVRPVQQQQQQPDAPDRDCPNKDGADDASQEV